MSLQSELGMRKGFDNPAHEALLNIYYTASRVRKKAGEFFRGFGVTDVQFNVLSLLKHQSGESSGLTQVELSRMMLVNRANIWPRRAIATLRGVTSTTRAPPPSIT